MNKNQCADPSLAKARRAGMQPIFMHQCCHSLAHTLEEELKQGPGFFHGSKTNVYAGCFFFNYFKTLRILFSLNRIQM